MNIRLTSLLGFAGLLLLTACGGGGGGGGGNGAFGGGGGGGGGASLAPITTQNAPEVAGAVVQQALSNGVLDGVADTPVPVGAAGAGMANTLIGIGGDRTIAGALAASVVIEPCAVSGTVDIDGTVANPQTLTPGDEFAFDYMDCDNGTGAVVNGGLTIAITAFDGDPQSGLFRLGMRLTLSSFQVTAGADTSGASGTIDFEIDTRTPPNTVLTLSASSLTTTTNGVAETVTDLSITTTTTEGVTPTAVTVETSFRLSSPALNGDVIVSTVATLQSFDDGYPYNGEIEISGANNASIRIIALDETSVRLEVDSNGDGSVDDVIDTTWAALMAEAA